MRLFLMLASCLIGLTLAAADSFVIREVRVFDGTRIRPGQDVLVSHGKIAAVGPRLRVPADAETWDGHGKTLLPGLMDTHIHVTSTRDLAEALQLGVTTVFDMFTTLANAHEARTAAQSAQFADFRSAGTLVTAPGGHGTEYGVAIPTLTGPPEAQAFVDARLAEGSDYIKVIYDDGGAFGMRRPTLSRETLRAVIAATHRRGKLAIVHVATLQDARDAVSAGADAVTHVYRGSGEADFLREFAKKRVFFVPTLAIVASSCTGEGAELAADSSISPYLSAMSLANLSATPAPDKKDGACQAFIREVGLAARTGVRILAGTDWPNPPTAPGASVHAEMAALVKAGLTPLQALASATSLPAKFFGLADRGRIAPGLRADLVLVNGDPSAEILNSRHIVAVWRTGVAAKRSKSEKSN